MNHNTFKQPTRILVIGSSNTDMVIKADNLPKVGETVLGGSFLMSPGGKGANQAVAAARMGGQVQLIAKVGNDIFGSQAINQFKRENIETSAIFTDADTPSGVALIGVDTTGENYILVAPGANHNLTVQEIEIALQNIGHPCIVLIQLEIPSVVVEQTIALCAAKKMPIILNPAPASPLRQELYKNIWIITPNETETELLTGVKIRDMNSAKKAAEKFRSWGTEHVVITMGGKGAFVCNKTMSKLIPTPNVTAKDSTGAGDCFNGALAVALSENMGFESAVHFACKAASISVTRLGAQSAMPYRKELG
ncbi:ribokinase [Maribacter sp. 2307ULW6-5]|uniref:ribokinase n=1 Tax=Maribacter sp. 2307ULW6-5 TaxID=3386275 RepID=UPI0039BD754A